MSGLLILSGLFVLVVGVIALIRGRVGWARLRGRAAGVTAMRAAIALLVAPMGPKDYVFGIKKAPMLATEDVGQKATIVSELTVKRITAKRSRG